MRPTSHGLPHPHEKPNSQSILFMDAPSVQGFESGCSSTARSVGGPAKPPPPHLMVYLAGFSATVRVALCGSKPGCVPSSLKEHPWCQSYHQLTNQLFLSSVDPSLGLPPRALVGTLHTPSLCTKPHPASLNYNYVGVFYRPSPPSCGAFLKSRLGLSTALCLPHSPHSPISPRPR